MRKGRMAGDRSLVLTCDRVARLGNATPAPGRARVEAPDTADRGAAMGTGSAPAYIIRPNG